MKKAVLYLNQFFGRVGGKEMAGLKPQICEGEAGFAIQFAKALDAQITYTIICGDNFMESNTDEAVAAILDMLKDKEMDIFLAGPAFNEGSYGVACGTVCKAVKEKFGIPAVTSMNVKNPGAEMFKKDVYILNGGNVASKMREDISAMVNAANKILKGSLWEGEKWIRFMM